MDEEITQSSDKELAAPIIADQEWANAWTHGISAALAIAGGIWLVAIASQQNVYLAFACGSYMLTVTGTFVCSTLSHAILRQPWLNLFRAWDQAMIYLMITGTYTPIVYGYATDEVRVPLLIAIWVAAAVGFLSKITLRHRINSIGTVSYLLLGWLPSIPLMSTVPSELGKAMLLGGVLYTVGIVFLRNDKRVPYFHAAWHLFVLAAAAVHFLGIYWYVVCA